MQFNLRTITVVFVFALVCGAIVGPVGQVSAQSPVPTVTSDGCEDIPAYLAGRDAVAKTVDESLAALFPDVTPFSQMSGDEWRDFLLSASPNDLVALAGIMDERAVLLSQIVAPPIVAYHHDLAVEYVQRLANFLRDAAKLGVFSAALLYGDRFDQIDADQAVYAAQAVAICPAYQAIIDLDITVDATPVASPTT